MKKIGKTCGHVIDDEIEIAYEVNHGLDTAYYECESCHEESWECGRIISCEACGEWFDSDVIHSEALDDTHSFAACPACGCDICEGVTRDEMMDEVVFVHKYSAVVSFFNGYHRGYMIEAEDMDAMMDKLISHIKSTPGMAGVQNINVAEILLDEDVIK